MAWSQQLDLDDARLSRHVDGVSDSLFLIYGGICVSLVLMAGLMSGVSFPPIALPCAPGSLVDDDRSMIMLFFCVSLLSRTRCLRACPPADCS